MPVEGIPTRPSTDPSALPVATDKVGTDYFQIIKMDMGADGLSVPLADTNAGRLPVGGSALGNPDDTAATTDGGTFSLVALVKRLLGKLPASLGQKAMTASLPVVVASDQSSLPTAINYSTATQTVAIAANDGTGSIDVNGYELFGIVIPSTFDGTQIQFLVSIDNTTFQLLSGPDGAVVTHTVAASSSVPVWEEVKGWRYYRIRCVTAQATTTTVFGFQLVSGRG